jgi:hypothetical protein
MERTKKKIAVLRPGTRIDQDGRDVGQELEPRDLTEVSGGRPRQGAGLGCGGPNDCVA